jgi:hypothetical protein
MHNTDKRLLAIEKAVGKLLSAKIGQWNELRMTVCAASLLALRDAYRPPGDKGENDQYPLRKLVQARAEKGAKGG